MKQVTVTAPNQTEPVVVNQKKLEYKWGMNVLGESIASRFLVCVRLFVFILAVN